MSGSENAVVLYVPVVDVGWSQDLGRLLCEGGGALSVRWFSRMRFDVPLINQMIHCVTVPGLLLWNKLPAVVVGLDV
jgi:hypothetical protein